MKKLIRLFIAIFCIFFVLQAMPGSFLPFMRTLLDRSAQAVSDMTLLLAGKIDEISGAEHVDGVVADGEKLAADLVLVSTGVRANIAIAQAIRTIDHTYFAVITFDRQ